jgi:hypothetical protein
MLNNGYMCDIWTSSSNQKLGYISVYHWICILFMYWLCQESINSDGQPISTKWTNYLSPQIILFQHKKLPREGTDDQFVFIKNSDESKLV